MNRSKKGMNKKGGVPDQQAPAFVEKFLDIQQQKILLERENVGLKKYEIAENSKLAKQSMETQERLLKDAPQQRRKTIKMFGVIGLVGMLIFFVFLFISLYFGYKEFLLKFIGILSYIVTTAMGYYFGRKSKSGNDDSDISIIDQ